MRAEKRATNQVPSTLQKFRLNIAAYRGVAAVLVTPGLPHPKL